MPPLGAPASAWFAATAFKNNAGERNRKGAHREQIDQLSWASARCGPRGQHHAERKTEPAAINDIVQHDAIHIARRDENASQLEAAAKHALCLEAYTRRGDHAFCTAHRRGDSVIATVIVIV